MNGVALCIIGVAVIVDPYVLHHFMRFIDISLDIGDLTWVVYIDDTFPVSLETRVVMSWVTILAT